VAFIISQVGHKCAQPLIKVSNYLSSKSISKEKRSEVENMLQMPGYGGYSDMGYGMMGGSGWWMLFGWLFMILFWAAIILAIIWLYKQIRGEPAAAAGESALEILKSSIRR
jgi:hypothetical protein